MNKLDRYELVKEFAEKVKEKLHYDYVMPSGETDEKLVFECVDEVLEEYEIFNCDVCKRHCYFASPCTPDDCEARYKEFCEREGYKEIKNLK